VRGCGEGGRGSIYSILFCCGVSGFVYAWVFFSFSFAFLSLYEFMVGIRIIGISIVIMKWGVIYV
jgi:hypothetical protein